MIPSSLIFSLSRFIALFLHHLRKLLILVKMEKFLVPMHKFHIVVFVVTSTRDIYFLILVLSFVFFSSFQVFKGEKHHKNELKPF